MRVVAALASALAVAAWACDGASSALIRSGIRGRTLAGPVCPVETIPPRPKCAPRPIVARLRVRRIARGAVAKIVRSHADGHFEVRLEPGKYVVQPLGRPGVAFPRPPHAMIVRVSHARFTRITVTYDTGIR